jgi:outer membrane protein TolC
MEREVTPMLLAEQDLRAAEARAIDAQRQASIALIRLRRAAGGAGAAAAVGQSRPASPEPDAPTPVSWSTR